MALHEQERVNQQQNECVADDEAFEQVELSDGENVAAEPTSGRDVEEANPEPVLNAAAADDAFLDVALARSLLDQDIARYQANRANDGFADRPLLNNFHQAASDRFTRDQENREVRANGANDGLSGLSHTELAAVLAGHFRAETARIIANRDENDSTESNSGSTHSVSTHSTSTTLPTIRQPCWVRSLTKLIDILSLPIGASLLKWYLITRGFLAPTNEPLPQVPERVFVLFQRVMASVAVFLPLDWPLLLLQGVAWIPFFIKALVSVRDWLSIRSKQDEQSIGRTALFLTALVGVAYVVTPPKP